MIFEVERHDVEIGNFENLEVDPCRLFHGDHRARRHLRYLAVEYATFD